MSVHKRKINFSIKKNDIKRYNHSLTDGEKFKIMLRGLWKDLVIRKVKNIKIDPNKELTASKITVNDEGHVNDNMLPYNEPFEIEEGLFMKGGMVNTMDLQQNLNHVSMMIFLPKKSILLERVITALIST